MDWFAAAATCLAFFVKGLTGFANTLVFTTAMGFSRSNLDISPVELLVGYPANCYMMVRKWRELNWKALLPLGILVLAGCVPGALLLRDVNADALKILFGLLVIGSAVEMLFRNGETRPMNKPVAWAVSLVTGVACGLFGAGAMLAAYLCRHSKGQDAFKSGVAFVFFLENTFRVALYAWTGILTLGVLKDALFLLPFMAAGLGGGLILSKRVGEKRVRLVVLFALMLSGAMLVANTLMQMIG